ncbi:hypothetical protein [Sulfuricurvum sp.]|uniref:hypothetical protein n=1 Tax=Sulfuricurvum sp. TaxID=2025608 RepID=UPI003BB06A01
MTKISLIVTMALLSCAVFFSGCTKTIYLPCKAEEPMRTYHKNCGGENNVTAFAQCASEKHIQLEGDYEILLTRFRSCK